MKCKLYAAAVALALLSNAGCAKVPDLELMSGGGYELSGSFHSDAIPPGTEWPRGEAVRSAFGSWNGNEVSGGRFASAKFTAPAAIIVFLSGFPSRSGNSLYLEDPVRNVTLALRVRNDPGQVWQRYVWKMPTSWRGHTVQLVADRHATEPSAWFGLTIPEGLTTGNWLQVSFSRVSQFIFIILWESLGFCAPGLAIAWLLESKYVFDDVQFICLSLVSSGAVGYLAFWLYLLSAGVGRAASVLVLMTSVAVVVYATRTYRGLAHKRQVIAVALLMLLVTTFYTAIGFLYERAEDAPTQAELRFVHSLPIDNVIPYYFADRLYHGDPVRPFLLTDWKSSDRPPLQTGIALIEFPMWSFKTRRLDYQILGTFLQSMWLVPIWGLMSKLALPRQVMNVVFSFCIFSGFFLLHTFYVWPKLLAASYFLIALVTLGYPWGRISAVGRGCTALAGAAIGLALLSHGGVIFSILAFGVVLLATRSLPSARSLLVGILMIGVLLVPWVIYQKVYDPPGDRLLKWHLAGVTQLDSRPFLQLLVDAYSKVPASVIIENKIQNIRTLFGPSPWPILRSGINRASWERLVAWYKSGIFFSFFQTLGLLNLGFFAFAWARSFRKSRSFAGLFSPIQRLLILPIISLAVWCLLMYLPGSTLVHQGSLADVMLFYVALGVSLATFWPRATYIILGLQILTLFPLFALTEAFKSSPANCVLANGADPGMECLGVLSLIGLVVLSRKTRHSASELQEGIGQQME